MKPTYKTTINACFTAYIVQAIINNFVPLLFITFGTQYGIPLSRIALLVSANFAVQLTVDFLATFFVDKIGYRASIMAGHIAAASGLCLLAVLPQLVDPFGGILAAVVVYAIGGGIIEVLVSPIMESCPAQNKEKAMSLLHSFYCWGHAGVVLVSTLFFALFGINNWHILAFLWAAVPVINTIIFAKTPLAPLIPEGEKGMTLKQLAHTKAFWIFMVMMVCAGASEQSVSQWASAFAEQGLGISKTMGDLAGPMVFALLMGASRAIFASSENKINLDRFMRFSAVGVLAAYIAASLAPHPLLNLVGCGLCGLCVGIMWPGTFSKGAAQIKNGGTAFFAFMALAGDVGCSLGPGVVGLVTDVMGGNMKAGILVSAVFPLVLLLCLIKRTDKNY